MYAIIETGGKQYKVSEGDILRIERVDNSSEVEFNNVLMVSDGDKISFGSPFILSAKVTADVIGNSKAKKVLVFKQRQRKGYRRLRGHRQQFTEIKIKNIVLT